MSDDNVQSVYEFNESPENAEAPPLLPDSEYRSTVRAASIETSKNSGNKMVKLEYVISPDEYPADFQGAPDGTKGVGYIVLDDSPSGRYRYKKACEAHGVTPVKRVDPNQFMGQDVMVRVKTSSYQGELRYDPFNAVRPA